MIFYTESPDIPKFIQFQLNILVEWVQIENSGFHHTYSFDKTNKINRGLTYEMLEFPPSPLF